LEKEAITNALLKSELRLKSLGVSGTKLVLAERLFACFKDQEESPSPPPEAPLAADHGARNDEDVGGN